MGADDFDDYWAQPPKDEPTPAEPALQIDTIDGVKPLDEQFGVAVLKTVPDALYEPLFGQPTDTPLHTYAILDAAKVPNLPELLETSTLTHRCLFKGDAYDELKDVAPWIVQLEDDNAFTRNLFTQSDAPWHLYDAEPGIFLRSGGTLDDMWKHFRKFTKMQVEEDKRWLYFRFWESRGALYFFDSIKGIHEKAAQWFLINGGTTRINTILGNLTDSPTAWAVTPNLTVLDGVSGSGPPVLSDIELRSFEKNAFSEKDKVILARLVDFAAIKDGAKRPGLCAFVSAARDHYMSMGFRSIRDFENLILVEYLFGFHFSKTQLSDAILNEAAPVRPDRLYYAMMENREKSLDFLLFFLVDCGCGQISGETTAQEAYAKMDEICAKSTPHSTYISTLVSSALYDRLCIDQRAAFIIASCCLGEFFYADPRYRDIRDLLSDRSNSNFFFLKIAEYSKERFISLKYVKEKGFFSDA